MDNAVALVQAYLRVNGYFTVAEYPVAEATGGGGHRMLTDLDILAFRFPRAGVQFGGRREAVATEVFGLDPALGRGPADSDMIVGEVKEGRARLNHAARDPAVVRAALVRFGCCTADEAPELVDGLLQSGSARTGAGHLIRMVVFGASDDPAVTRGYSFVPLGHVVEHLRAHLRRHWDVLRHTQTKDPVLGFLMTLEKAERGSAGAGRP